MSDIEKLKSLDPKEIFQKTYIAPKVLHYLIEGNFDRIGSRAKALGFVQILERELGLDLSELRERIDEYYGQTHDGAVFEIKESVEEKKKFPLVLIVFVLLALGVGVYYFVHKESKDTQKETAAIDRNRSEGNSSSSKILESNATLSIPTEANETKRDETNRSSQIVDRNESEKLIETNETNATNESSELIQESNQSLQTKDEFVLPSVTIIPKKKIWIGIVYLDNFRRKNIITSRPIELNTSRDQLIVTGHGLFTIDEDGVKKDMGQKGKVRMLYRAGQLEIIDKETFKKYNRGKDW